MGLNIKNREAHRLAEELARRTGESMAAAVTTAVRERLDRGRREQGEHLADRLLAIGKDCAKRLKEPMASCFTTTAGCRNDHRYVCTGRNPYRDEPEPRLKDIIEAVGELALGH